MVRLSWIPGQSHFESAPIPDLAAPAAIVVSRAVVHGYGGSSTREVITVIGVLMSVAVFQDVAGSAPELHVDTICIATAAIGVLFPLAVLDGVVVRPAG